MNAPESKDLLAPGAQLGKYEIVHRIAFGGMAEIYLARVAGIEGFEKYVVLKRILPQYAADPEFVRMFLKEARLAATLDHANIAHVYDIGSQAGSYFFTMEYLHGEDLRWIMRKLVGRGQGLPLEHALEIIIRAASGLHFAHERKNASGRSWGIVHRDVSPSNIIVTYDGGVKVVDFGVAKMTAEAELSRRHVLKGKLGYMSPEQINGGGVDRRADVFALGIILYEITTRTRLFKGSSEVDTMRLVVDQPVPPPSTRAPEYPVALERIVMRALDKNPAHRYQTARELELDLEGFARGDDRLVSSAALGNWMEATFERKPELWRRIESGGPPGANASDLTGSDSSSDPPAAESTKIVPRRELRFTPPRPIAAIPASAVVAIDISEASAATNAASVPQRPRRPRRRPLIIGAAVLGLLIAGSGVAIQRVKEGHRSAPATDGPVLLVAEKGKVALETPGAVAAEIHTVNTLPPPSDVVPDPVAEPTPRPPRARRQTSARGTSRPVADKTFSVTLARRQTELRRCFSELPPGAATPEVSLRFQVATDGRVMAVDVLPATQATTPLGQCLQKVASQTVFAPQQEAIAFRIPLTVQRQSAAGPSP